MFEFKLKIADPLPAFKALLSLKKQFLKVTLEFWA